MLFYWSGGHGFEFSLRKYFLVLSLCELLADLIFLRPKPGLNFKMHIRRQKSAIHSAVLMNTKSVGTVASYQNVTTMMLNLV